LHQIKVIATILFILGFLQSCKHLREKSIVNRGYEYPSSYEVKDTNDFFFPLRSKLSKRDSLSYSYQYWFYNAFNEPNLSLKYIGTPTYRISYYEAFGRRSIITLSGRKLTVKDAESGNSYVATDTSKLMGIEKEHYQLLLRRYPLEESEAKTKNKRLKHYLDSIMSVYPQLIDPNYYKYLVDKVIVKNDTPFVYETTTVVLNDKQYEQFADLLNNSGYWNLPYNIDCDDPPADGTGFIFEANTEYCYNAVGASSCDDSNSSTKLKIACQRLIDFTNFGSQNPNRNKRIIVAD
jgi:hypothetical protein